MKKITIYLLLFCSFLQISVTLHAEAARAINTPQIMMTGARSHALGITNPVILDDISSSLINPAVYAGVESMPLMASFETLYDAYTYLIIGSTFQIQSPFKSTKAWFPPVITLGLNYGNMQLSDIPKTTLETFNSETRVRPIGTYSSGFHLIQASAAGNFFDFFGFETASVGVSTKILQQYMDKKNRSSLSFDVGFILSYDLDFFYFETIQIGASILDIFASPLTWDNEGESFLPPKLFTGTRAELFDEKVILYLHTTQSNIGIASEFKLDNSLSFQMSTDFDAIRAGVNILFSNITGFDENSYDMRLDYAYSSHKGTFEDSPSRVFTFNILGSSRPKTPQLKNPAKDILVNKSNYSLYGYGPKKTTIRLYNNNILQRTVQSNRMGFWKYPNFPLSEGENLLYAAAYSIDNDLSVKSEKRIITSDTIPPQFDVNIIPQDEKLSIQVIPKNKEKIARIDGIIERNRLDFQPENENQWKSQIDLPSDLQNYSILPEKMKELQIFAQDEAGNNTEIVKVPFFVEAEFPKNKHVHYTSNIRIIGKTSSIIKSAEINGESVTIDPQNKFAFPFSLKPGKNPIVMTVTSNNDSSLSYYLKVLRLKTYSDLTKDIKERREIQFLSTLGILDGELDRKYYPNRPVTRRYITRTMVKILDYALEKVDYELFPDVAITDPDAEYIQTAINTGLIFGYPDLTFKPDEPITLAEAAYFLNTAGIIDEQPLDPLLEDEIITRKELAKFLAYTPSYERKIERLIDWNKGYKIKPKK